MEIDSDETSLSFKTGSVSLSLVASTTIDSLTLICADRQTVRIQNGVYRSDSLESDTRVRTIRAEGIPFRVPRGHRNAAHNCPSIPEVRSRSPSSLRSRRTGCGAAPQASGGRPVPGLGQIQIRDFVVNSVQRKQQSRINPTYGLNVSTPLWGWTS